MSLSKIDLAGLTANQYVKRVKSFRHNVKCQTRLGQDLMNWLPDSFYLRMLTTDANPFYDDSIIPNFEVALQRIIDTKDSCVKK